MDVRESNRTGGGGWLEIFLFYVAEDTEGPPHWDEEGMQTQVCPGT